MANDKPDPGAGTLQKFIQELGAAFAALETLGDPGTFAELLLELGIDDPPDLTADATFAGELNDVAQGASNLMDAIDTLSVAIDGSASDVVAAGADLLTACGGLELSLAAVGADLPRVSAGTPAAAQIQALAPEFESRVIDEMVARQLAVAHPLAERILRLCGVIETSTLIIPGPGDDDPDVPVVRRRLFLDRVPQLLTDPVGLLAQTYNWGQANLRDQLLLQNVADLFEVLGPLTQDLGNEDNALTEGLDADPSQPPTLDFFNVAFSRTSDPVPGIQAALFVDIGDDQKIQLAQVGDNFQVELDLGGSYREGLVAKLLPPTELQFVPPSGSFSGHLGIQFVGQSADPNARLTLFSISSGCRVDAQRVTAGLVADLSWNGVDRATADLGFLFRIQGGRVLVTQGQDSSDGFLNDVLPADGVSADFDLAIRWTAATGLHIEGSAGLDLSIPIHKAIGPVNLGSVGLQVKITPQNIAAFATATAAVVLGPITASIAGIGVEFAADLASRGSFGNANVDVQFALPTGIGIAVDAGPVHGGGFISFDQTAGRYSGALQLSIYDIAVNAFGLLETKLPTGPGYSFVIVISAEFTPIQLGFGFTLNGVGGMVGINRGIDTDALASLVRAGQSEGLLFPKNVVADAPAIVRDLTSVFPATQGHYVFGPLGKLGWGTPSLITGEIGIILELPGPVVVILGEVKCLLPKPDAALVKLNLSVDGELDFPKKTFAMDAALHNSVINGFPVSGQMATRVSWGDQPNFVFSIGGFHPAYTPPPRFPKLQPLALDFGKQGTATITVTGFFAVTSNTVQVGGEARLRAGGHGISLDASVSVKALFVFSPFSFEADISASVKISFHGYGPSVHLHGLLEGPSPWHVKGEVCVSILWWDACLGFDVTFGNNQPHSQPELDPWVPADTSILGLRAALSDPGNWSAALVPGAVSSVTRAQGTDTLIDPVGGLTVRQKVAPVETANPLTKFGVAKVPAPISFRNVQATLGSGPGVTLTPVSPVNEFFAPAQFFDMDDGKKLSSAGFEHYQAGYLFSLAASPQNVQAGSNRPKTLTIQTFIIGSDGSETQVADYTPSNGPVTAASKRSAVAKGGATLAGTRRFVNRTLAQAFSETVPTFVLASNATLTAVTGAPAAAVRSATLIARDAFRAQNVEQAAGVQVAAFHELAA